MSFEAGLYRVNKYKDYTADDFYNAEIYLDYFRNDWLNQNYTEKEYCEQFDCKPIPQEDIDYFNKVRKETDENNELYCDELANWGYDGSGIYNFIKKWINKNEDYIRIELSRENIIFIISSLWTDFSYDCRRNTKPLLAVNGFKDIKDESTGESYIKVFGCDGIEISTSKDEFKRYFINEQSLGIVEDFFEEGYLSALDTLSAFIDCLYTTNFDNELVFFEASW